MTARPRDIGTMTETAVVRAIRPWFPHAERRALTGVLDQGDITGTPGVVWEVKGGAAAAAASDGQVALWLAETERERLNAGAAIGVLVMKRKGAGVKAAGRWWAVTTVEDVCRLGVNDRFEGTLLFEVAHHPVRMHLDHLCQLLARAGYGEERTL